MQLLRAALVVRGVELYKINVIICICCVGTADCGTVGRSLVRFQMVSLEFFIDIILPIAQWHWGLLSLQQKHFLGVKAAGA
jgi:hypothetical protein